MIPFGIRQEPSLRLHNDAELKHAVDAVLHKLKLSVYNSIIDTRIIEQMIKLAAMIMHIAAEVSGVMLPFEEEQQLLHSDPRKIDRVARSLVRQTDRVAFLKFRTKQRFNGRFPCLRENRTLNLVNNLVSVPLCIKEEVEILQLTSLRRELVRYPRRHFAAGVADIHMHRIQ